jgi:hypothetical protein
MQEKVMHLIGVMYAMIQAIIEKHVLNNKECMAIQMYVKYILLFLFFYHVMIYYYIFLCILNLYSFTSITNIIR